MLKFGQIVKLTQDAELQFSSFYKNMAKQWATKYNTATDVEKGIVRVFLPAGTCGLVKWIAVDNNREDYMIAVPNPVSGKIYCGGVLVKAHELTDVLSNLEKKEMEPFQAKFLIDRSPDNLNAVTRLTELDRHANA